MSAGDVVHTILLKKAVYAMSLENTYTVFAGTEAIRKPL
ncbi:hypothetical protein CLV42_104491 [Chitinophaga ginsengisoli]|uniref:Uncharacterized protein n=1 Tax=Chitinophaga ginsengisoli TaxID=363837 RepID=A0A2P8GDY0_9BACT|nr:hypothetical protein CLV42_104491 [Chitinophaga ginsengisoli]